MSSASSSDIHRSNNHNNSYHYFLPSSVNHAIDFISFLIPSFIIQHEALHFFAVSTLVVGAISQNLSAVDNTMDTTNHKRDRIYVRGAMAKECVDADFGDRQVLKQDVCKTYDDGFHTLKARVVLGKLSLLAPKSADITSHKHCNSALTRDSKAS